jgi:hypothetical protein
MRSVTLALAAGCFVVLFSETAYAQVPNINVQETCRAAAGVMVSLMGGTTTQSDVAICVESENKARQQLIKDWSTYRASDRASCIQANVYLPSYVEWLTCFEMNKSVREGRQAGSPPSEITNPDGTVTMPPVSSLGIMGGTRRSYAQTKSVPRRDQGTVRSAAIKATESAWNKLPPNEFACVDQKLTARGESIQSLARRGILPSDASVAEILAQCLTSSSPAPSPVPPQQVVAQPAPRPQQPPSSKEQGPPSQVEAQTELRQTIEGLQTELSAARLRVAALETAKVAADNAVKQAEQARSDAERAQRGTESERIADRAKLDALTAQLETYKKSAEAKSHWWWAYAMIAGLIGVIVGLAAFPLFKWARQSPPSWFTQHSGLH